MEITHPILWEICASYSLQLKNKKIAKCITGLRVLEGGYNDLNYSCVLPGWRVSVVTPANREVLCRLCNALCTAVLFPAALTTLIPAFPIADTALPYVGWYLTPSRASVLAGKEVYRMEVGQLCLHQKNPHPCWFGGFYITGHEGIITKVIVSQLW